MKSVLLLFVFLHANFSSAVIDGGSHLLNKEVTSYYSPQNTAHDKSTITFNFEWFEIVFSTSKENHRTVFRFISYDKKKNLYVVLRCPDKTKCNGYNSDFVTGMASSGLVIYNDENKMPFTPHFTSKENFFEAFQSVPYMTNQLKEISELFPSDHGVFKIEEIRIGTKITTGEVFDFTDGANVKIKSYNIDFPIDVELLTEERFDRLHLPIEIAVNYSWQEYFLMYYQYFHGVQCRSYLGGSASFKITDKLIENLEYKRLLAPLQSSDISQIYSGNTPQSLVLKCADHFTKEDVERAEFLHKKLLEDHSNKNANKQAPN